MANDIRFAVDGMLGKLAKYLRALGYDTTYERLSGGELLRKCRRESRVLVTVRNLQARGCRVVKAGRGPVEAQLARIFEAISIKADRARVLTMCLECNVPTDEIAPAEAEEHVPENVRGTVSSYRKCPACGKIFWWGSHADRMMGIFEKSGVF